MTVDQKDDISLQVWSQIEDLQNLLIGRAWDWEILTQRLASIIQPVITQVFAGKNENTFKIDIFSVCALVEDGFGFRIINITNILSNADKTYPENMLTG